MVRTISRAKASPRSVCVWPNGVVMEDIQISRDGVHYAKDTAGDYYAPTVIPADVFENAFGAIPNLGTAVEMGFYFQLTTY